MKTQKLWLFMDRKTHRLYTDCVADNRNALLEKAVEMYGRSPAQWANHPDSKVHCISVKLPEKDPR